MSTTLLLGAHSITLRQRRLHRTTSCVNGLKTFGSDSQNPPSTMQNVWMTRLLLGWFPSSTSLPIVKNAVQIIRSTMNQVQVEGTWKVLSGRGLDYKVEGAPKIKVLGIGATQWTISLDIGTGPSLSVLVCASLYPLLIRGLIFKIYLGPLLAKKYLNAVKQAKLHEKEQRLINAGLPATLLHSWTAMITIWENNRSAPNPYYTHSTSMQIYFSYRVSLTLFIEISETEVRQRLTLEEEEEQVKLETSGSDHWTRTKFLLFGLDIEHTQCVFFIPCYPNG
jgi:hypothetical protein